MPSYSYKGGRSRPYRPKQTNATKRVLILHSKDEAVRGFDTRHLKRPAQFRGRWDLWPGLFVKIDDDRGAPPHFVPDSLHIGLIIRIMLERVDQRVRRDL